MSDDDLLKFFIQYQKREPVPNNSDEFIVTRRTTNGATTNITYVVSEIGMPERPRDFWVCDIQAMQKI
jgi:hypothetical protein